MNLIAELDQIRDRGIDSAIIKSALKKFEAKRVHMLRMIERYKSTSDGVPVLTRYMADSTKVNNKVNNDFFSEIVDIKTGYFAGSPFSYQYDKTLDEFDRAAERISNFITMNNIADLDSEATKDAAVCGYGSRLLYINEAADERVMNIPPYECLFFSEREISDPEYAMRVYDVKTERGTRRRVEFYDAFSMRVFYEQKKNSFVEEADEEKDHNFGVCPLYGIPNNEELQGDVDKCLALIDAYDRTISDVNSEIESFRLAYMLFKGGIIDEETLRQAQKTGAFTLPDDGDVRFLTKDMNDTIVENHLTRLQDNIYRFSKTPDLTDEAFGGTQSGVALKFKLFPLEAKCKKFERKFDTANRHMLRGLCHMWKVKGEEFDPYKFFVEYKRNFPMDVLPEAEVQMKLKGLVSEQTRLSLASFIDDAEYEIQRMEEEALEGVIPTIDLDRDESVTVNDPSGSPIPAAIGITRE